MPRWLSYKASLTRICLHFTRCVWLFSFFFGRHPILTYRSMTFESLQYVTRPLREATSLNVVSTRACRRGTGAMKRRVRWALACMDFHREASVISISGGRFCFTSIGTCLRGFASVTPFVLAHPCPAFFKVHSASLLCCQSSSGELSDRW